MPNIEGGGGAQAGHKALHTCTSWYAYAAMFSSSNRYHMIQLCYHTIAYPRIGLSFCQYLCVFIVPYSLGAQGLRSSAMSPCVCWHSLAK